MVTDDGVAVSATKEGLLPISQTALAVIPKVAYHEYEGIALDLGERERLEKDLGDKPLLMLWNHGTLAVGETAGQCWLGIFNLAADCQHRAAVIHQRAVLFSAFHQTVYR